MEIKNSNQAVRRLISQRDYQILDQANAKAGNLTFYESELYQIVTYEMYPLDYQL